MRPCTLIRFCLTWLFVFWAQSSLATGLDLDRQLDESAYAGCAQDVTAPAARTQRKAHGAQVLPPEQGLYLGAYQIPVQPSSVQRFSDAFAHMPPIVYSFHDFFAEDNRTQQPDRAFHGAMEGEGSLTPLQLADHLAQRGSVLSLSWAIYCCEIESTAFWFRLRKPHNHINRILAGRHDDVIRDAARRIAKWGGPIMLNLVPEMNWQGQFLFGKDGRRWMDGVDNICTAYGDPTWPDGPERIRDLYMRVIDIFRQEGAHNVTWMIYAGNQYMVPGFEGESRWLHPKYYYPGDDYIDWIGQSVYFTDPNWDHGIKDTGAFDQVFGPGYAAWSSVTQKPMMLAEFGLVARQEDQRSALWDKTLSQSLKAYPRVKAVTIADAPLFRDYFNLPMPSAAPEDTRVIRKALSTSPYFDQSLRLRLRRSH